MSQLKEKYQKDVVKALKATGKYPSTMDVPRVVKVVVNMSVNALVDRDMLKAVSDDLAKITGQRPTQRKATKSISNFKLREGMPIGAKVTLRGRRMYEFLERLIHATLPRIRDFRGVPAKAFDGRGNYTLGLKEQTLFPEIESDKVKRVQGMDITIVTTAQNNADAKELLQLLGMPFAT
ncbi:MAG TPA: 50S ribosomal protein L5 [Kiritimatiellia bacterium]|jgi:large subunit ribosomal protein L5|nr:50S ribosomal protein L5 [Kiritimatiellia bacterium]OQC60692.1 MAG: 50S ribosomal protein L5 [Verrucomicrobia bacterium ADurb.Bin018]MBP9572098.1 50S ribosomal protein L5 [Kiritimatiellia bacterium]HOE00355.1 50S ribosomal protein L5 [Kiritimatiellia bacterium]HOE36824.1 50S ribosomal protein L5 [Kiritimatiellia bacterium]